MSMSTIANYCNDVWWLAQLSFQLILVTMSLCKPKLYGKPNLTFVFQRKIISPWNMDLKHYWLKTCTDKNRDSINLGRGLPYKKKWRCSSEILKNPLKGMRSCFVGVVQNVFFTPKIPILKQSITSCQIFFRSDQTSRCGAVEAEVGTYTIPAF